MKKNLTTIIVLNICAMIVLWAFAIGWGYHLGRTAGWRDGIGNAKRFLTIREMKAYEDGRKCGVWMGRWEAYDLGFADGQQAVKNLSEGKVYLQPMLNKEVRLRTLDRRK